MKKIVHLKYLLASDQDALWGLVVNSVGFQKIEPGEEYPPKHHPTRYLFSAKKGRILQEYQLLYISGGKGKFMSSSQKKTDVKTGNMFLLYPGEWHNYAPDKNTGWSEHWIGFTGVNIDNRILHGFFNKKKPIFNIGLNKEIIDLYQRAIEIAESQKVGFQQMLAGIVNYLLGIAYSQDKLSSFEDLNVTNQIERAKIIMYENYNTSLSPESIADTVCMSYSWFRRVFKQYTGLTPYQYILELRLRKGKELLVNSNLSSQEISFEIGFENPDYFCTAFKKKVGSTPIEFRKMAKGEV